VVEEKRQLQFVRGTEIVVRTGSRSGNSLSESWWCTGPCNHSRHPARSVAGDLDRWTWYWFWEWCFPLWDSCCRWVVRRFRRHLRGSAESHPARFC